MIVVAGHLNTSICDIGYSGESLIYEAIIRCMPSQGKFVSGAEGPYSLLKCRGDFLPSAKGVRTSWNDAKPSLPRI